MYKQEEKLKTYVEILLKWQKKINLISPNTINDVWNRHIIDSLQILKLIPDDTIYIIDLGSGAGLPGIPLAIESGIKTFLVESDMKKSVFLSEVIRNLDIKNVQVLNQRIENAQFQIETGKVVITARALAELTDLFELIEKMTQKNAIFDYILLLPKGKNVSRETNLANQKWTFDILEHRSITSEESVILEIKNLKKTNLVTN